jgi:uncharacterized membrane protein
MLKNLAMAISAIVLQSELTSAVHTDDVPEALDAATRPDKCYGIALADATDFGPYQAGALIGLLKH